MPFHPDQLEAVRTRISIDLLLLEPYGSAKLYLCWYDQYLIPDSEWAGVYPCSKDYVHISDVLNIVKTLMKQPYIVRHNIINAGPLPAFLIDHKQDECEKYIEICLIQN